MLEKTFSSKIKRGLLYLTIPFITGCAINNYYAPNQKYDDIYHNPKTDKEIVHVKKDTTQVKDTLNIESYFFDDDREMQLENTNYCSFYFRSSPYRTSFGWDFDNDGIINFNDPWPLEWGPFVDMNNNGIVDLGDWQVADLTNPFWDRYKFKSHMRWQRSTLNPFLTNGHMLPSYTVYDNYNFYPNDYKKPDKINYRIRKHSGIRGAIIETESNQSDNKGKYIRVRSTRSKNIDPVKNRVNPIRRATQIRQPATNPRVTRNATTRPTYNRSSTQKRDFRQGQTRTRPTYNRSSTQKRDFRQGQARTKQTYNKSNSSSKKAPRR